MRQGVTEVMLSQGSTKVSRSPVTREAENPGRDTGKKVCSGEGRLAQRVGVCVEVLAEKRSK